MIYVIKQNDYVYITQKKRDLDSNKDPGELLLTLNWGPDEKSDIAILEEQLRPYIDLENSLLTKRFKFSETVLEIIKSHPKRLPKYTYAYKKDAEKLIQEVNTCIDKLKKFELLEDYVTIDLSVEEIFVNIAHYAYGAENTDNEATILCTYSDRLLSVSFIDSGKPFNPLNSPDPDITLSAEERKIGGLGIFLTKKFMTEVSYEYSDGKNILTIKKKIL
jgi:anti-sigma regulatory factor (Ser/Thr protein kinase)